MISRITVEEFTSLPEHEQYEVVSHAGNLVEFRNTEEVLYELYAVDMFFVEIAYTRKGNMMMSMNAFNTGERLDPYSSDMKTLLTGILRS